MKTIAIYFSNPDRMGYPFDALDYYETYEVFMNDIASMGADSFIARGDSYQGNGVFSHGWKYDKGNLVDLEGPLKADIIYNKGKNDALHWVKDCEMVNDPMLDKVCVDKVETVHMFPELSPASFLVNDYDEYLKDSQDFNEEEFVVLKKNFESGGNGIHILKVKEVTREIYDDWSDVVVQEFMDSSVGIPGVVQGLHDLRITVVGGKPTNALIRVPKEGMLLANISQGGSGMTIHLDQVPQEVMDKVQLIIERFEQFAPSIFGADFMNTKDGYKLIEINSRPGLLHPDYTDTWNDFNHAVVELLVNS